MVEMATVTYPLITSQTSGTPQGCKCVAYHQDFQLHCAHATEDAKQRPLLAEDTANMQQ